MACIIGLMAGFICTKPENAGAESDIQIDGTVWGIVFLFNFLKGAVATVVILLLGASFAPKSYIWLKNKVEKVFNFFGSLTD